MDELRALERYLVEVAHRVEALTATAIVREDGTVDVEGEGVGRYEVIVWRCRPCRAAWLAGTHVGWN